MNIPLAKPFIGEEECAAILKPLHSGWLVEGPHVQKFEQKFAAFTGATYATATSSCTAALHTAVTALRLQRGDEVIVPGFTWAATSNVVEYMGATPVFCDIDLGTFTMDVRRIEELITPRTKGIIPVHLFGLCADMDPLLDIAQKHHLWVVEDAACALGAHYRNMHAGNIGNLGCFSFHPRKSITTGEGGMIITNDEHLHEQVSSMRNHGADTSSRERFESSEKFRMADHPYLGYNYRMTDMQGALGVAQMERLEWILKQRKRLAYQYDTLLASLSWLRPQHVPSWATHGYQSYVCLFNPEEPTISNVEYLSQQRNAIMKYLASKGVASCQGTHAPFLLEYYTKKYGYTPNLCPQAFMADRLSIALPFYPQMLKEEQEYVVKCLREWKPRYSTHVPKVAPAMG
ncbi:MAG: DegT/DnrJ/EryC1/StrS family aminotransferase [Patescibacteria group bacterium]